MAHITTVEELIKELKQHYGKVPVLFHGTGGVTNADSGVVLSVYYHDGFVHIDIGPLGD